MLKRAAVSTPEFIQMDNFTRADTSLGALGTAAADDNFPPFSGAWSFVNGDAGQGQISSNRLTAAATKNVYATQTLAVGTKIRRVRAVLDWAGTYTSGVSTGTIIIAQSNTAWLTGAVHLQVNPYYMELDYITAGPTINLIAGGNSSAGNFTRAYPIPIGTSLPVYAQFDDAGNYLINAGGKTLQGNDSHIAAFLGPTILCQCLQNGTGHTVRWSDVRVGTKPLGQ